MTSREEMLSVKGQLQPRLNEGAHVYVEHVVHFLDARILEALQYLFELMALPAVVSSQR